MKKLFYSLVLCTGILFLAGCASPVQVMDDEPLTGEDVEITLDPSSIGLENEFIRVLFNRSNGSFKEIYNKEKDLYLVQNHAASSPVGISYASSYDDNINQFYYIMGEDTLKKKALIFNWVFGDSSVVSVKIELSRGSNELKFYVKSESNGLQPIYKITYPIITGIESLKTAATDNLVSPFATGYLFKAPFTAPGDIELGEGDTIYPQGWNYPMQFISWYSEGTGGFYIAAEDPKYYVKSFPMKKTGSTLRFAIVNHINDISARITDFNYPIVIANMNKGNWYEAADKYRGWAKKQPWTAQGTVEQRSDISKWLYEEVSLVNFGIDASMNTAGLNAIIPAMYDAIKAESGGKIMNVFLLSWVRRFESNMYLTTFESFFPAYLKEDFVDKINNYGDKQIFFTTNTLFNEKYMQGSGVNTYYSMIAITSNPNGGTSSYYWDSDRHTWFMDPSVQDWVDLNMNKDEYILDTYNTDGFYYDIGAGALAPLECFNPDHEHGNKTNLIPFYQEMSKLARILTLEQGTPCVGMELISEPFIPYTDYYQARANGGLLSWMEHDRIRSLIAAGYAEKVPLFDYVYHAYGPIRTDGYMLPSEEIGEAYYSVLGSTVLWGGLPQFNFEFLTNDGSVAGTSDRYLKAEDIVLSKAAFIGELADARLGFGKEYLVYGEMKQPVDLDCGKINYAYTNINITGSPLSGTAAVDKVIKAAYTHNGKAGLFFLNVTDTAIPVNFDIDGSRYGIKNAGVYEVTNNNLKKADLQNGACNVAVTLPPHKIVMLELR
jgi:hypothetical protein